MGALTAAGQTNGTSTATYTIPAAGLDVEAVYAAIDTTGAAGAVTAELTITDKSGAVIARKVQNTTIDQGVSGSATWALQLLDDCVAVSPSLPFPQLVVALKPLGTLRGYWRLGEAAAPMADSSGWSSGPNPLTVAGAGSAPTFHQTGALPPAEDDGSILLNGAPATGQYLVGPSAAINTGINSGFSIMAWVKPTASASTWIAAVYNNIASSGGFINGWGLTLNWTGTGVQARLRRIINDAVVNATVNIPSATWTFLVGTYDGTTLRLYANGALSTIAADSRADTFNPYATVTVGTTFVDPFPPVGTILGDLDEVAIWGTVLTADDVAALYAAGIA